MQYGNAVIGITPILAKGQAPVIKGATFMQNDYFKIAPPDSLLFPYSRMAGRA
jgi:hypothetical protein